MAVTPNSRSYVLTAVNDEIKRDMWIESIQLVGTGMTADQRLTITDSAGGVMIDHYVESATENKEFLCRKRYFNGLKLSAVPAGGTWTVVVGL